MAQVLVTESYLTDIGDAIRGKNGGSTQYKPSQMAAAITAIPTVVTGTFTTGSSAGVHTLTIPYTGSGYPIMAYIVIDGGAYVSGTDWYTSVQRYAVGVWAMSKSVFTSAPSYGTSGAANQGVTCWIYKNSTCYCYWSFSFICFTL